MKDVFHKILLSQPSHYVKYMKETRWPNLFFAFRELGIRRIGRFEGQICQSYKAAKPPRPQER